LIYNKPLKYKDICENLGIERLSGSKQQTQLRQLHKIYKFEKNQNGYYTFYKKYNDVEKLEIQNKIFKNCGLNCRNKALKDNPNFKINKEDMHKSGIYKIECGNLIYIGKTKDFYKRYTEHKRKLKNKTLYYDTSELLLNNGTFEILELENNKKKRNILETKWIKRYRENKNYICVNSNNINYKEYKLIKINLNDYNYVIDLLRKNNIKYE